MLSVVGRRRRAHIIRGPSPGVVGWATISKPCKKWMGERPMDLDHRATLGSLYITVNHNRDEESRGQFSSVWEKGSMQKLVLVSVVG